MGKTWKTHPHRAELLALYAEVDALLSDFTCEGSTDCCRFGVTGREPYPTPIEVVELTHALKASPPPKRRALPLAAERRCPVLSDEGKCRAYASRPFGCRTFFCERVTSAGGGDARLPRREVLRVAQRVADLAARHDPRDPRPRPLTRALYGEPPRT
jgi:uncharacterized protein